MEWEGMEFENWDRLGKGDWREMEDGRGLDGNEGWEGMGMRDGRGWDGIGGLEVGWGMWWNRRGWKWEWAMGWDGGLNRRWAGRWKWGWDMMGMGV